MPRPRRITESGLHRENDPALLVLMSLARGPKHGHALIGDIEELTEVRLGPGTLYGAITRLENERLIEAIAPTERRRPYRITDSGVASLTQVVDSMEAFVKIGRSCLAHGEPHRRLEEQAG